MEKREKILRCKGLLKKYKDLRKLVAKNTMSKVRRTYVISEMRQIAAELKDSIVQLKYDHFIEQQRETVDLSILNDS